MRALSLLALLVAWTGHALAASGTLTLQPAAATTDDNYAREDNRSENNGGANDLRVKASGGTANRHAMIRIPLSGLAGRTVLRAWLELQQSAGSSSIPIDARVHALTESWSEMDATWDIRDRLLLLGTPWNTPGGTRLARWSDRAQVSAATNNGPVRWQVGPLVEAWNSGQLPNYGVVLAPVRTAPDREVSFRSSDNGTLALNPRLVIDYTDEPPAIRAGVAEIQPRAVRVGTSGASLSAWLDVDASGTAPSGTATGFDALLLAHGGGLRVTGVTRLSVAGSLVPTGLVSWTDDGTTVTFRFPRVQVVGQVQLDFLADILAPAATAGFDLPMSVDDSATPGAGHQFLWPGNGDRITGNGDDWILTISDQPPVSIDLRPDAATIPNLTCLPLSLVGRDALGNVFPLTADSILVQPKAKGTIGPGPSFCAATTGLARVVAYHGSLRDTSFITTVQPNLTQIRSLALTARDLSPRATMVPGETLFVNLSLSDADGLQDVVKLGVDVVHPGAAAAPGQPPYGASFAWSRGSGWSLNSPLGTSWQLVPGLCVFDEASTDTAASPARLAFVVGRVARASNTGAWSVRVQAAGATPSLATADSLRGIGVAARHEIRALDAAGAFSPGLAGATALPLHAPASGRIGFELETNAPATLEAIVSDMPGVSSVLDTLRTGSPQRRVSWSATGNPGEGGRLDTLWTGLAPQAPQETEAPIPLDLHLWLDHPATIPAQDYAGSVGVRLASAAFAAVSPSASVPLRATVVNAGLAARLALAEVAPHSVTAGATGQTMAVYLLPVIQGTDTGVDRVRVSLPDGYGAPVVSGVTVAGGPAAYRDLSVPGLAEVSLATRVTSTQLLKLTLLVDAPLAVDPAGSAFIVSYDDSATTVPPQAATEGDANGMSDGNSWIVRVLPGPLARITVAPSAVEMCPDSSVTFVATTEDAFGNPVTAAPAWRLEGSLGTLGASSGVFTATTPGSGLAIASSGAIADTAAVTVLPARAIRVRAVSGPSTVYQGQASVPLTVRVENFAPGAVTLDTLGLRFSRAVPGDASGDFSVVATPPQPVLAPPGTVTTFAFSLNVSASALTAPLAVQAAASGVESGSGLRLRDPDADSSLALSVVPGGLDLTAVQTPAPVRPGSSDALLFTLRAQNLYPVARSLTSLILANRTSGPGTTEQLDAELGEMQLHADDGDGVFEPTEDKVVATTTALSGAAGFAPLSIALPAGSTRTLFVSASLPVAMRDGDRLDLELASAADVGLGVPVSFRNAWPVGAPGAFTVDGMVGAAITAVPVGPTSVHPGDADRLALDLRIPANGYAADVLQRLGVVNQGTAQPGGDLSRLRAWADDGDGAFSAASDTLLGVLAHTGGGRWQLNGLARAIPAAGKRVFVTADLSSQAADNSTVVLAVPAGPDPGIGVASGNSGPLDEAVANPGGLVVSELDRVTMAALSLPSGVVRPGDRQRALVRLLLSNNYVTPRTLTTLVLDNRTAGPGTVAERDAETRTLTLRLDGNGNGAFDDDATDPVLATGPFLGGEARFAGLSLPLPGLGTRQLLVMLDVSATAARDGDVLSAVVEDANSVSFAEPTSVNGVWPLDSGARWTVDGFVAAQATRFVAPGATVGPGDGPLLALDLIVPANGYSPDVLRGVRVVNRGSALAADLAQVQLWRDGGDGVFTGGGDDRLLGPLSALAGEWASPLLSENVSGTGARLFVSVSVAASPAESTTVRLAIPAGGVEFASGNDGPLDAEIANPEGILISSAPLLATFEVPAASTVGQTVRVSMIVRNRGTETVRGIAPATPGLTGTATLTAVTGPSPASFDLAPAEADTFEWQYRADATGEARFEGSAAGLGDPSGLPRAAPRTASGLHRVFVGAAGLDLSLVQTMPIRVNRGQADVVPFSLTLDHPGGAEASDVRVDRIRVRLEQESGAPIVPSSLVSRVVVNEGTAVYLTRTALETSGSEMDLVLATPAIVTGTQPATLSLRLDISDTTTVPNFRLVIVDSSRFGAQDQTSGAPVTVRLGSGGWPVRSGLAQVVAEATRLEVSAASQDTVRTGRGAAGAVLLRFRLLNPGVSGISSSVRVSSLSVGITDSAGADQAVPGATVSALRVLSGASVLGSRAVAAGDPAQLPIALSPPLALPANAPLDLVLVADLAGNAPYGRFGARLLDSTLVDARDANTLAAVPVFYDPDTIRGGPVLVESPADSLLAFGTRRMPATVLIGARDVHVLSAVLRHPGAPGAARVRVDSLAFVLLDEFRRPLVPATYLDRLRLRWNGAPLASVTGLPASGNRVGVALPGPRIEPGDSARVEIHVDIAAAAPAGYLELVIPDSEWAARDDNTGAAVAIGTRPGWTLPLQSGLGRLVSPARELAVGLESLLPPTLAADGRAVAAARLTLRNADPAGAGPIPVDHLVVRAADRGFAALPIGAPAVRIEAWVAGAPWAQSAALTPDSATATLTAGQVLEIPPGVTIPVEIRVVTRAATSVPGLRAGFDASGIGVIQPASALLAINVRPEPGAAFPMWTDVAGLAEASLASSYSNYPNPFAAGREATTLAYYLPGPARVWLRILSARGEPVARLLDGAARPGGMQSGETWDGRNGRGEVVYNGVYIAELEVRFDDGSLRQFRRKVAVVR